MQEFPLELKITPCIFRQSVLYYLGTDAGVMEW